jgi:hypothetical protein
MAEKIKLVQGDNRPYIRLTLTNSDGTPMDISDPFTTVIVYFRRVGEDEILATLVCSKQGDGTDGRCFFNFPGTTLDVEPGLYEGEIEVTIDGDKQTIYDTLKFNVRAQFN